MVGSQPILSEAGLRIQCEVSRGVGDRLKLKCQRQGLRIDECGGCLDEGEPIFKVVSLFKGKAHPRKFPHSVEIVGPLAKGIVHEVQECGGAGHELVADAKTVGRLE
jgi:hypothetical protein